MTTKLRKILAELRSEFESLYRTRMARMILFGSQARGDARSGSDIDVAVVLAGRIDPGKEIVRTGKIVTALSLKYDTVISCVFVSADRYSREMTPLLINVRGEGVTV